MGAGGDGDGSSPCNDDYIIIGAGPVGLLAALGLVQEQRARKVSFQAFKSEVSVCHQQACWALHIPVPGHNTHTR